MPTDAVAFYSAAAGAFHASYAGDANRLERVQVWRQFFDRHLGGVRFAYDLGCGSGILACDLARRGIETVGVDGAAGMLAIARQAAAGLRGVSFVERRLPLADPAAWRPADAVISSSALEYLPSLPAALACIHALLRPGGVLVFSVSNQQSLSRRLVRAVHWATGRPAYLGLLKQFSTPERLGGDLRRAGFAVLDHAYFARADRINRALGRVLPARLASNMVIIAARRA